MDSNENQFSSVLPIVIYIRSLNEKDADWHEFDRGPGYFHIPPGSEAQVRIQNINDKTLATLIEELRDCPRVSFLNLSENRKITNVGAARLSSLKQLTGLNLSSCDITNEGLAALTELPLLTHLNLSYCNRVTDDGVVYLRKLNNLEYLDLQGVLKISTAGVSKLRRRDLVIHK